MWLTSPCTVDEATLNVRSQCQLAVVVSTAKYTAKNLALCRLLSHPCHQ